MNTDKFETSPELWEKRELGASLKHAEAAPYSEVEEAMNSLNLKPISIRLQTGLIEDLKLIAKANGIGYQPLMRDVLQRFVDCEKKMIMKESMSKVLEEQIKADIETEITEDVSTPPKAA